MEELLAGLEMEILERIPAAFVCNCSKARIQKALISIPKKDLRDMIEDGEPIEVKCQFCNTAYPFEIEELKEMLAQCEKDRV